MVKIIVGGIIGAVIAFAWSFVSWTVLPWHTTSMNKFKNQELVMQVMKENAPKSGVYVAPFCDTKDSSQQKPFVFAQVNLKGVSLSNPTVFIFSFLTQFVGAALISWLLLQTFCCYGKRVLFVATIGLLVGVLGLIPNWNWFGASCTFTLVMIADLTITWFLVGIILAAYVKPKRNHERMM